MIALKRFALLWASVALLACGGAASKDKTTPDDESEMSDEDEGPKKRVASADEDEIDSDEVDEDAPKKKKASSDDDEEVDEVDEPAPKKKKSADDEEVGFDKSVTFPVGVGGKGNEGVTALVKQTPGTIGYVEFGYAEQNKLPVASVENKSGNFIAPTPESGAAALASVELPDNLRAWPVDSEAPDAYPITTFSWLLLYRKYDDAAKLKAFFEVIQRLNQIASSLA